MSEHESHLPTYNRIIIALSVMTAAEFVVAFQMVPAGGGEGLFSFTVGLLLLVGMAGWKAVLVARFFMHLKFDPKFDPKLLAWLITSPVVLATPLVLVCIYDAVQGPTF